MVKLYNFENTKKHKELYTKTKQKPKKKKKALSLRKVSTCLLKMKNWEAF